MRKIEIAGILNEIFEDEGENRVTLLNNGDVLFEMAVKDGGDCEMVKFLRRLEGLKEILKGHGYEMKSKICGVKEAISDGGNFAFYSQLN